MFSVDYLPSVQRTANVHSGLEGFSRDVGCRLGCGRARLPGGGQAPLCSVVEIGSWFGGY